MRPKTSVQDQLTKLLDKIASISPYLPGTLTNIVSRAIHKEAETLLDVGGGKGQAIKFLSRKKFKFTVNADIAAPPLLEARARQTHGEYVLCDARALPFKDRTFDVVLCMELVEHIEKEKGYALLKDLERVARKQVIVTTPPNDVDECALRRMHGGGARDLGHVSSWEADEFAALGYRAIKGNGFRFIRKRVPVDRTNAVSYIFFGSLHALTVPLVFWFLPNFADHLVCTKEIGSQTR